jgi:eukaryotic-like serine/threonine-protein kinase
MHGHYKILELAGPDALGEVYRARDTRVGRTVTITAVSDAVVADPRRREQFLHGARAAAAVSHPNIVTLYEVGEDDDGIYLVHEFIQGQTLKNVIADRPLNPRRAVDLANQIAEGLADAHAADLVHGHLTADSIVVTSRGNAKIMGLGVAGWSPTSTPLDVSAEAAAPSADLAAIGMLLFEMLIGRRPSPGAGVPSAANASLPRELDPIVAKALGKSGGYESAVTMAAELRAVGAMLEVRQEASAAAGAMAAARRKKPSSKWLVIALVVGVVTALALGALALNGFFRPV